MVTTEKFARDRLTVYAYCNVSAYVWAMYGMGPALLIMRDETGMSRTLSSLHSTALAFGVILAGLVGARLITGLGRGGSMDAGAALTALAVLGFAFGPVPVLTMASAFVMGFAGSITINAQNAFFSVHHGRYASTAIGESNGYAVAAGLASPLALGALVGIDANWRIAMLVPVFLLALSRLIRGDGAPLEARAEAHDSHIDRLTSLYWWSWLSMLLCVATEFAFVLWAGDVLRDQAGASTAVAAAALSAVAVGMMLARFTMSAVTRRISLDRLFLVSLLVPAIAWLPMWLSTSAPMILACMFVIGFGLGYHFPVGMSRMLIAAPGLADEAANRSSLASGIAISGSPFLLAVLSDAVGLHTAFIMVPVLLAAAVVTVVTHPVR